MKKITRAPIRTLFIALLCLALAEIPYGQAAYAGMIPTSEAVSAQILAENRIKVNRFVERADVQAQFEKLGVSSAEASTRVASLSNEEINRLAGQIDQAPAGGDVIVISLTTVLLVIVILLLLRKI